MSISSYQQHCLSAPVFPSVLFGGAFTALEVARGFPFSPQLALLNVGGIYMYNALTCPMVAIHGRESAIHNTLSGAILGYIGVKSYNLAVPFVEPSFFWRNPQIPKPLVGALMYGGIGTAFALLGDKKF